DASPFPCARSGSCSHAFASAAASSPPASWRIDAFAPPMISCCCAPKWARSMPSWHSGGPMCRTTRSCRCRRANRRAITAGAGGAEAVGGAPAATAEGVMQARQVAWIGLGSNLDQPACHVRAALDALTVLPGCRLLAASALYRTTPVGGPPGQPDYCNACAALACTACTPLALLDRLQAIEHAHGRVRD